MLESVDGVPAVGPPGPLAECPQPASLGELQLSGPSSGPTLVYYSLDVGAALTAHDAGSWSVTGDRVRFRSYPERGHGAYIGEVRRGDGGSVRAATTLGGTHYSFRRVRSVADIETGSGIIRVTSVPTLDAGLRVRFRNPDGIETRAAVVYQEGFATGGPPGAWFVALTPPEGYRLAAGQPEQLCLAVRTLEVADLRVVLEPIAR